MLGQNFASLAYGNCRDLHHVLNGESLNIAIIALKKGPMSV